MCNALDNDKVIDYFLNFKKLLRNGLDSDAAACMLHAAAYKY